MDNKMTDFDELIRNIYVNIVPDAFWVELQSPLWHYTTFDSLFGIIQSKELWLSDYRNLNDKKEVQFQLSEIVKICNEHIKKNKILTDLLFSSDGKEFDCLNILDTRIFIFSLSEKEDDLNQWKGYANKPTGVSIGFDLVDDENICYKEQEDIYIGKVIYEKEEKIELLVEYFAAVKELLDKYQSFDREEVEAIATQLELFIQICCICFKSDEWKDESEIRIFAIDRNYNKINYRLSNGFIVPYGYLSLYLDILTDIIIITKDQAKKKMLSEYLEKNGLAKTVIKESRVDMRFGNN